jgi:hypothetical protein
LPNCRRQYPLHQRRILVQLRSFHVSTRIVRPFTAAEIHTLAEGAGPEVLHLIQSAPDGARVNHVAPASRHRLLAPRLVSGGSEQRSDPLKPLACSIAGPPQERHHKASRGMISVKGADAVSLINLFVIVV